MALKVNPLSLLTGISHAHLQTYHQGLAFFFVCLVLTVQFFFSLVHVVPMLWQPMHEGGSAKLAGLFKSDLGYIYWSGVAAFGTLVWIVLSSLGAFRKMSYSFFVVQHICSIILILGFLFHHTKDLKMLKAPFYLWSAVAFWIFSIVVRSCLVLFSSNFFVGPRARVEVQTEVNMPEKSEAQEASELETLRFRFQTPLRWKPGQHIYVRFPGFAPVQAHPFSIMSVPGYNRQARNELVLLTKVHRGTTRKIFNYINNLESDYVESYFKSEMSVDTFSSMSDEQKQIIRRSTLMKAMEGKAFPNSLVYQSPNEEQAQEACPNDYEQNTLSNEKGCSSQQNETYEENVSQEKKEGVIKDDNSENWEVPILLHSDMWSTDLDKEDQAGQPPLSNATSYSSLEPKKELQKIRIPASRVRSTQIRAYLDGPYGCATDPATSEHVILFAGGTGVAHIFPLVIFLLQRSLRGDKTILTRSIHLVWSTRSMTMVNWLREELLSISVLQQRSPIKMTIDIHITTETKNPIERHPIPGVISHFGTRTNIGAVLEENLREAKEFGSMTASVYVCGPHPMVCEVSNRVAALNFDIVRGRLGTIRDLMLEVEHFSW